MRRTLVWIALVAGLLSPALWSPQVGDAVAKPAPVVPRAHAAKASAVPVQVGFGGGGRAIPSGFFGLSIEYNELARYEQLGVPFANVLNLLRPGRGAPLTLRIGGKSADHMLWEPTPLSPSAAKALPHGVFQLGPNWVTNLAQLVRQRNLKAILDLNLAVHSPSMAANFAKAVRGALPGGRLAALEIGNEPDMYHYQPRLTRERVATTTRATPAHWWNNYSSGNYRRDYQTYARAVRASVPGVRVGAPDITRPNGPWLTGLSGLGKLGPGFLAIHRYGASGCFAPTSNGYPTISNLLNNVNSSGLAASVAPWARYAHGHHMGLRVSEINSVSCGHDRGVANSFATALWAPDTLFAMIKAGVDAVSWHIRPNMDNSPFRVGSSAITSEPELYGLAVFSIMTRGRSRLINTSVSQTGGADLKAWAVKDGRTVRILLINKGRQAVRASLKGLHGVRHASVRWLTAPGVHATGGVRFGGQRIGSDGKWQGRSKSARIPALGGRYYVHLGAYSEALVTL